MKIAPGSPVIRGCAAMLTLSPGLSVEDFHPARTSTAGAVISTFQISTAPLSLGTLIPYLYGQIVRAQHTGAIAQLFRMHTDLVEDRDQQVRHRRILGICKVASSLELTTQFTGQQAGQVPMPVQIAIAHTAAVRDQAVIQQ